MKTLHIGVFDPKLIHQASPYCGDNVFAKGFEKLGHNITRFDYRAVRDPNNALLEYANIIKPDLFWFGKCELISPETIRVLKSKFPNSVLGKWAADVRDNPTDFDLGHLQYIDLFAATYAGEYLQKHKKAMPQESKAMSIFSFVDSEFYKKTECVKSDLISDILWTGRRGFGDNKMRNEIIDRLQQYSQNDEHIHVLIAGLKDWFGESAYLQAINGTSIGIGSNSFNRRKYSSDRLGNYMSCGTFYMTQYIEGIEECFVKGENIEWFNSIDEMVELIKYYLANPDKRQQIAKNGQEFVLKHFDCVPLVQNILQVLETGKSKYQWDEVY